jgi:hypothetical protein
MAGHIVTGPVAVLPTDDGSERYLYRGALVGEGFTDAGIKHATELGLIKAVVVEKKAAAPVAKKTADVVTPAPSDAASAAVEK